MDPAYVLAYGLSLASVAAVLVAVPYHARKSGVSLGPGRLIGLVKDEASRLASWDPVFLMHISIALGVGLSMSEALLHPILLYVPLLDTFMLLASLPLLVGLVAAFAWRIQRYLQSKIVEKGVLKSSPSFSASSTILQLILMAAILLTTSELALSWAPGYDTIGALINVARNVLVVLYYAKPSVNLIGNFDRPMYSVRAPFNLGEVMRGAVDISQVTIGVSKLSQFEPYQKLSYDSCVEIGACEVACPATAAGRPLSPRVLVRKLSLLDAAEEGGAGAGDPLAAVGEDELWSCTSCGACVSTCPVSVKHLDIIYDLRRNLATSGKLDKEKSAVLQNLAQTRNPYGLNPGTRADWARDEGVDTVSTNPDADYLYWVGCVSSFDQRAQRVAKSMAKILKHSGVSFAIMGNEEACNGDPARRLGEEGRYQELAYQNIEKLKSFGVKKIIATCPHCFNTLKNEYPSFGGSFEVIYHTQLISDLIRAGKIAVPKEKLDEVSVTLHDACYASRYNSVFDEPREALAAFSSDVREMHRTKEKTFCCGAGGSNYWYKVPQQRSIASIRTEEAVQTGAKTIATECPFCLSMFDDTTKVTNAGMEVRDVAEIVADHLG